MKKNLILFTFLILLSVFIYPVKKDKLSPAVHRAIAQLGDRHPVTAWIFFTDKGENTGQKIEEARMTLSARTHIRRLRQRPDGDVADINDVPVNISYVDQIEDRVQRIRHRSRWLNAVSVVATGTDLQEIGRMPFVREIRMVSTFIRKPVNEPHTPQTEIRQLKNTALQTGLDYGHSRGQNEIIKTDRMHDLGFTGKGLLICLLDGGFDSLSHEAFEQTSILDTWDFVNNDPNVNNQDDMGGGSHGSRVLSAIGGFKPGKLIGPAYGADYILGKTENSDWERHIEEDDWIAGAEWADRKGADIISTSLGYREGFTDGEVGYNWTEIDGETPIISRGANIAASKGILIIKSAGNGGYVIGPANSLGAPAGCDGVMAIGSVNILGIRAVTSSVGPTADGRLKPDVMAMGVTVYTTSNSGPSDYRLSSGTSFACPMAAGAAALVWEANPGWSNWDVMDALRKTASLAQIPSREMGWGIIDTLMASNYRLKEIHPPRKFAISRITVDYHFFTASFDQLKWEPDFRNKKQITKFRIYTYEGGSSSGGMSFNLIKEVESSTTSAVITRYHVKNWILYKIIAVAADGTESDPNYTVYSH